MYVHSIIYIDDDEITRFLVLQILHNNNIKAYDASNGKTGIEVISKEKDIKYALLDLNMPVMDGYQFLKNINNGLFPELKIIVTSAIDERSFRQKTKEMSISTKQVIGYMEKPIHFPDLLKILSTQQPN